MWKNPLAHCFDLSGIWKGEAFIGSNPVIFCYEEFEKFALCKSVSQSEAPFIVYSEPIESGHVFFIMVAHPNCKQR